MKTLVLGATPNPQRYAFKAVHRLVKNDHEVWPVGIKKGQIAGLEIINGKPEVEDIHTVSLYIGPHHQPQWYDYIISLKPQRIIFNPGTENPELAERAEKNGIHAVENCTLVMLSLGNF